MGEAKRRKKLDPNYGSSTIKANTPNFNDLAIIDDSLSKFTSTLGLIKFTPVCPPQPEFSRKLNMPLDCNYSVFHLYPKRHDVIIEGVFFTKKGFSQAVILGRTDTTHMMAIEEINNKKTLIQLRDEMFAATQLDIKNRTHETKG